MKMVQILYLNKFGYKKEQTRREACPQLFKLDDFFGDEKHPQDQSDRGNTNRSAILVEKEWNRRSDPTSNKENLRKNAILRKHP